MATDRCPGDSDCANWWLQSVLPFSCRPVAAPFSLWTVLALVCHCKRERQGSAVGQRDGCGGGLTSSNNICLEEREKMVFHRVIEWVIEEREDSRSRQSRWFGFFIVVLGSPFIFPLNLFSFLLLTSENSNFGLFLDLASSHQGGSSGIVMFH